MFSRLICTHWSHERRSHQGTRSMCASETQLLNSPSAEAAHRVPQGFLELQQGSELTPGIFSLLLTNFVFVFFSFVIIFPKPYSQTQPFARARGGFVLVLTNGSIPLSSSRDTQNLNKKWALTIFWGPGSFSLDFQGEFLFHKALASCCHSKSCRSVACVMPAILARMLHYTRASK